MTRLFNKTLLLPISNLIFLIACSTGDNVGDETELKYESL